MLEADDEDDDVEARNKIKSPFCYDADTIQNQPSLFKLFMTEKLTYVLCISMHLLYILCYIANIKHSVPLPSLNCLKIKNILKITSFN